MGHCVVSVAALLPRLDVYVLTFLPPPRCFQWGTVRPRGDRVPRSGAGEVRGGVGVLEVTPPSSPPVFLKLGLISEVSDPYKAPQFWPGSVRKASSGGFDLTVKDKRCWFGCRRCTDMKEPESECKRQSHYYLLSYHGGGGGGGVLGKHHASFSLRSKSDLQRRKVTQKRFFCWCRNTGLPRPPPPI